jgi:catechol 2,3-dioxygenase-like lactoylglutathione lyase family enzyme
MDESASTPPGIVGIDHVVLAVRDVERALDFYHGLLGLEPVRLDEFRAGKAPFVSVRITPETIFDLFQSDHDHPDEGRNVDHICLEADPRAFDALRADLARAGHEPYKDSTARWGARGNAHSFYVRDPDGNQVVIRAYR